MSGHTPWWKVRSRRLIADAIYNNRWGEDNTEFAGERMDAAEEEADMILDRLEVVGMSIGYDAQHWFRAAAKSGEPRCAPAAAADLIHSEARWCLEQEGRGETPNAVDALLKVERILRDWESTCHPR